MEHINAPYNFVPLSSVVVTPEWADQVSHDLPFKDGISGELELTITAQTDILVGGSKEGNSVHFFQTPDGKYVIPGSSLRGMIRNVMEIATFSRMSNVDDKSYGLRDLSSNRGTNYTSPYMLHIQKHRPQSGFLRMVDRKVMIVPCKMARLDRRDLKKWINQDISGETVRNKYENWDVSIKENLNSDSDGWFRCDIKNVPTDHGDEMRVVALNQNGTKVYPVLTGGIPNKKKDFVFYDQQEAFDVNDFDSKAWGDFLFLHDYKDGEPRNPKLSWPNYWQRKFRVGEDVPVFYLKDDEHKRLQIGLAYLPKLAGDFSTYDMIRHTSKQHLEENGFDFTSLIFGKVGNDPEDALKGRAFFEPAILEGEQQPDQNPPSVILNGAKPSYFPNYIEQATDRSGTQLVAGQNYATYIRTDQNQKPKIRGWKRYPARPEYQPELPAPGNDNENVISRLHVLSKGSEFKSRLVFHNLKPEELGALLWSIQLEEGHRHSIGMGKPFGAGQVTVTTEWSSTKVFCNDVKQGVKAPQDYIKQFQQYMKDKWLKRMWKETDQVRSLLSMTYPEGVTQRFKGDLKHMQLTDLSGTNQFVAAKQATPRPLVLGGFALEIKRAVVIESTDEIWENANISYHPGSGELTASLAGKGKAILRRNEDVYQSVIGTLEKSERKKAAKNQLVKSVKVEGKGNAIQIKGFV